MDNQTTMTPIFGNLSGLLVATHIAFLVPQISRLQIAAEKGGPVKSRLTVDDARNAHQRNVEQQSIKGATETEGETYHEIALYGVAGGTGFALYGMTPEAFCALKASGKLDAIAETLEASLDLQKAEAGLNNILDGQQTLKGTSFYLRNRTTREWAQVKNDKAEPRYAILFTSLEGADQLLAGFKNGMARIAYAADFFNGGTVRFEDFDYSPGNILGFADVHYDQANERLLTTVTFKTPEGNRAQILNLSARIANEVKVGTAFPTKDDNGVVTRQDAQFYTEVKRQADGTVTLVEPWMAQGALDSIRATQLERAAGLQEYYDGEAETQNADNPGK